MAKQTKKKELTLVEKLQADKAAKRAKQEEQEKAILANLKKDRDSKRVSEVSVDDIKKARAEKRVKLVEDQKKSSLKKKSVAEAPVVDYALQEAEEAEIRKNKFKEYLKAKTVSELKQLCKKQGIGAEGDKKELVKSLFNYHQGISGKSEQSTN